MIQELRVKGMTCQGCGNAVTRAVNSVAPRADVSIDLASGRVDVRGDADRCAVVSAIEGTGFAVLAS